MTEVIKSVHAANFSVYGVHKIWKKLALHGSWGIEFVSLKTRGSVALLG